MTFDFSTAQTISFGEGRLSEVGKLAKSLGKKALLVHGKRGRAKERLEELLSNSEVKSCSLSISGEPTISMIRDALNEEALQGCDMVIALGGGSVLDSGKVMAAMLNNGGDVLDYLEVVGKGNPLTQPSKPYIAIPSTAGTGSEVTRNAVLSVPEHNVKVSMRSPYMLPTVALIDPELTYSLPPHITASTGLDALTQCLEPFVSVASNPLTDGLALEGLKRAATALELAYQEPQHKGARRDMAIASLCGGLALANAKLGAVHGFAGVLGGMFDAPHGDICARLLPFVTKANIETMRAKEPYHPALKRYQTVATILTGKADAGYSELIDWLMALNERLHIQGLATFGVGEQHLEDVVTKAQQASSMKGNPIQLGEALKKVLHEAL